MRRREGRWAKTGTGEKTNSRNGRTGSCHAPHLQDASRERPRCYCVPGILLRSAGGCQKGEKWSTPHKQVAIVWEVTFFLTATSVQSKAEKSPAQTAKLPPIPGA